MPKGVLRRPLFFPVKARKRREALLNAAKTKRSFKVLPSKGKKATKVKKPKKEKRKEKKMIKIKISSHKGRKNNKTSRVSVKRKSKTSPVKKKPLRSVRGKKRHAAFSPSVPTSEFSKQTEEQTMGGEIFTTGTAYDTPMVPHEAPEDTFANICPSDSLTTNAMSNLAQLNPVHTPYVSSFPRLEEINSVHMCAEPRWYRLAAPILPTRMRELFDRTGVSATIGSADMAALSCFFPVAHNGEWFDCPTNFVEHCKSISHRLICENAPCFPMNPVPGKWMEPIADPHAHVTDCPDNNLKECDDFSDDTELSKIIYMWFTRLHAASMHFFAREWNIFLQGTNSSNMDIAEIYQSASAFQSSAAEALSRQIAQECGDGSGDHVPERWYSIKGAAADIEVTLLRVYTSRGDGAIALGEPESKGLQALSAHLACTVVEALYHARGLLVDSFSEEDCTGGEDVGTPILQLDEECEESRISQLTLWLFMHSHA